MHCCCIPTNRHTISIGRLNTCCVTRNFWCSYGIIRCFSVNPFSYLPTWILWNDIKVLDVVQSLIGCVGCCISFNRCNLIGRQIKRDVTCHVNTLCDCWCSLRAIFVNVLDGILMLSRCLNFSAVWEPNLVASTHRWNTIIWCSTLSAVCSWGTFVIFNIVSKNIWCQALTTNWDIWICTVIPYIFSRKTVLVKFNRINI